MYRPYSQTTTSLRRRRAARASRAGGRGADSIAMSFAGGAATLACRGPRRVGARKHRTRSACVSASVRARPAPSRRRARDARCASAGRTARAATSRALLACSSSVRSMISTPSRCRARAARRASRLVELVANVLAVLVPALETILVARSTGTAHPGGIGIPSRPSRSRRIAARHDRLAIAFGPASPGRTRRAGEPTDLRLRRGRRPCASCHEHGGGGWGGGGGGGGWGKGGGGAVLTLSTIRSEVVVEVLALVWRRPKRPESPYWRICASGAGDRLGLGLPRLLVLGLVPGRLRGRGARSRRCSVRGTARAPHAGSVGSRR